MRPEDRLLLVQAIRRVLPNPDHATLWYTSPNPDLRGHTPRHVVETAGRNPFAIMGVLGALARYDRYLEGDLMIPGPPLLDE